MTDTLADDAPRPMTEAPRTGKKVLAWWPSDYAADACYVTTRCDVLDDGLEYWVSPWDSALCDAEFHSGLPGPTHFLPHPGEPK